MNWHCEQLCYISAKFNSEAWVWGRLCNPLLTLFNATSWSIQHQLHQLQLQLQLPKQRLCCHAPAVVSAPIQ